MMYASARRVYTPQAVCQDLAMRCVASCGLIALGLLGGCNQVFGISNTVAYDAPIDAVVNRSFVALEWQVSTTSDAPTLMPIAPMPKVRISKLGEAWTDLPAESATTYATDGRLDIPTEYVHTPWRLEYTLADGLPHEVQWQPDDKVGRIVVPVFGPILRESIPTMSGYDLSATGTATVAQSRLATTSVWSEGPLQAGASNSFDAAMTMKSLSGALGRPDTDGTHEIFIGFNTSNNCRSATGSAELTNRTLIAKTQTSNTLTWVTDAVSPTIPLVGNGPPSRLVDLGTLKEKIDSAASQLAYGVAPTAAMPGLAAGPGASEAESMPMPMPVMIPLAVCALSASPTTVQMPAALASLTKILHVQVIAPRTLPGGPTLQSGLETAVISPNNNFTISFPAPLVSKITLKSPAQDAMSIGGDAGNEPVMLAASNAPFVLSFMPLPEDSEPNLRVDAYDVILHTISGSTLNTNRIYSVPAAGGLAQPATVQIDGALLAPGTTYVFEIRAIKGPIMAPHGDFSAVDYPYAQTITFARTFTVQ